MFPTPRMARSGGRMVGVGHSVHPVFAVGLCPVAVDGYETHPTEVVHRLLVDGLGADSRDIQFERPTRLEVRAWGTNQFYALDDIAEVRVKRLDQMWLPDRWWWNLVGVKTDRQIIELGLSRSLRFGLGSERGTDIVGVPTLVFRVVRVHVSDPRGFARAVEKWLPGRVRSLV